MRQKSHGDRDFERAMEESASSVTLVEELVIETSNLARSFGDVHAVRGVDIAVRKGEIYGFLGPNGAGKSTVVKLSLIHI